MIKLLKLLYYWAPRLPWKFTLPLVILMIAWLALVSALLNIVGLSAMADLLAWLLGLPDLGKQDVGLLRYIAVALWVFFEGIVAVLILGLGLLASYNISAAVYRKIRGTPKVEVYDPVTPTPSSKRAIQEFIQLYNLQDLRIGIILAGGGAKGAYQAGAMKAVHEFLEANNALDKVRMIAGTSIGSWNAMFWLAGLVKSSGRHRPSVHEHWWRSIRVDRIMEFAYYFPLAKNSFFSTTPWQDTFQELFVRTPSVKNSLDPLFYTPRSTGRGRVPIHFYFTRSNVERGHLEFATNNIMLPNMRRPKWGTPNPNDVESVVPRDRYELIEKEDGGDPMERVRIAVFASMDLPPLFPYMRIRTDMDEWFEDGGVVDNLPIRFGTEIEECNLLFVLPLNASFEERATQNSVVRRLFRVMDIRQGVLERNSIKLARLYNDRARLVKELVSREPGTSGEGEGGPVRTAPALPTEGAYPKEYLKFVRTRVIEPVSVFAICPQQPLEIGTAEFWKPAEAGRAFDLMYSATTSELEENFLEATDPNRLRMALVSPQGGRTYLEEF